MIPKIIHYCWFGGKPLPELAKKCIASWRSHFPDYEIKEWNEENFNVDMITYTRQAYQAHKYAFVSDYARFWILYKYGGIYFDTDVEVINTMTDIVNNGPFMGIEVMGENNYPFVAPGLGLGATAGLDLYKDILDYYSTLSFYDSNGKFNETTVVTHVTKILINSGLEQANKQQYVASVCIYPQEYFNPLDSLTGKLKITNNTRSIHWYMNSWSNRSKLYHKLSRISHRLFGLTINKLKNLVQNI